MFPLAPSHSIFSASYDQPQTALICVDLHARGNQICDGISWWNSLSSIAELKQKKVGLHTGGGGQGGLLYERMGGLFIPFRGQKQGFGTF